MLVGVSIFLILDLDSSSKRRFEIPFGGRILAHARHLDYMNGLANRGFFDEAGNHDLEDFCPRPTELWIKVCIFQGIPLKVFCISSSSYRKNLHQVYLELLDGFKGTLDHGGHMMLDVTGCLFITINSAIKSPKVNN